MITYLKKNGMLLKLKGRRKHLSRGKPGTTFNGMQVAFELVFEGMDRILTGRNYWKESVPS